MNNRRQIAAAALTRTLGSASSGSKGGGRVTSALPGRSVFAGRAAMLSAALVLAFASLVWLSAAAQAAPFAYDAAASEELSNTVPGGAFGEPYGLTFDSAGNLYVTDTLGHEGNGVIDKFNSENAFQAQLGGSVIANPFTRSVAVNDENGHLYVSEFELQSEPFFASLYALDSTGAELSQWLGTGTVAGGFGETSQLSVAVDNSPSISHGDVYVAFPTGAGCEVDVFEPRNGDTEEGEVKRQLQSPEGFGVSCTIAVDPADGDVYVADSEKKVVDRFSPTGAYETQITGPAPSEPFKKPTGIAVSSLDGHVFVIDQGVGGGGIETIDEFGPAGELVRQITETKPNQPLLHPTGVAIQTAGPHAGAVYVADAEAKAVDIFAELPPAAPQIESEGVTLGGSTATLFGEVDPRGAPTGYRFEYGACATPATCAATPFEHASPVPDAALGFEDFNAHAVAPVQFGGLIAGATYHFRLVAHNALGGITGEERTFIDPAGNPFALPDQRQWQLVSPADKGGAQVGEGGQTGVVRASAAGDAVTYLANAPTEPGVAGSAGLIQVLSSSEGSGWSSRDLASPHRAATGASTGVAPEYRFFGEEDGQFSAAVDQPYGRFNPDISSEASEQTPYLRALGSCSSFCYRPLVTAKPGFQNAPAGFGQETLCQENNGAIGNALSVCGPMAEGATPDAHRIIIRSATPLVAGAPAGQVALEGKTIGSLYEWSAGQLQLISILPPDGSGEELPAPLKSVSSQPRLGAQLGLGGIQNSARRAISADGSRIFWEFEGALYMRDTRAEKSIQIDLAEPGCLGVGCQSGGGRFQIASADGSRVFFTDFNRLTSNSGASAQNQKADLYECQIVDGAGGEPRCLLTDLTPLRSGEAADVQGDILGASADGSTVYFVANGALTDAPDGEAVSPSSGSCDSAAPLSATCNLYEYRAGSGINFVSPLSMVDERQWSETPIRQLARVSPDGRWLAFMSSRPITGYDNRDAVSGKPDAEAFLYDAASGVVRCVSCNPTGSRPTGVEYGRLESGASEVLSAQSGEWQASGWVSVLLPHTSSFATGSPDYQPRYLSDSGRLYFNSLDALVPSDTNATGDVYQYEPPGVGSCTTASATYSTQNGGCVDLISSGTSPERSAFLDASESGDDVFFLTTSKLSPRDVDNAQDVYDAHSCEEAAGCLTEPAAPTPPCSGESCQGHVGAPAEASPESQSFVGPGNPKPSRKSNCPKGKVKKHGKCVKQQKKKKRHSSKGSSTKHKRVARHKRGRGK